MILEVNGKDYDIEYEYCYYPADPSCGIFDEEYELTFFYRDFEIDLEGILTQKRFYDFCDDCVQDIKDKIAESMIEDFLD